MPGSIINNIKNTPCGWDKKALGKGTPGRPGHSHKELMRCLYKSNLELRNSILKEQELEKKVKALEGELGQYIVKEELKKESTGTGLLAGNIEGSFPTPQVDPLDAIINAPPLGILKDRTKNDKELAKDLMEVESINEGGSAEGGTSSTK